MNNLPSQEFYESLSALLERHQIRHADIKLYVFDSKVWPDKTVIECGFTHSKSHLLSINNGRQFWAKVTRHDEEIVFNK